MAHSEQSIVNQGWAKKGNDLFNQPYDRTDEIFAKPISAVPYVTKMASRGNDVLKLILLAKVVICSIPITKKLGAIFLYGPDRRKVVRTTDE